MRSMKEKFSHRNWIVGFLLATTLISPSAADVQKDALNSTDSASRQRALQSLMNTRIQTIQLLKDIVGQQREGKRLDYNSSQILAINSLGEMRAQEAVVMLCDKVQLRASGRVSEDIPFGNYPSVGALVQIGNPSVQEILRRMRPLTSITPEYASRDLRLFAYIIREVDGHEVGLFRLQLAARDAQGTHKINLLNLIEIYQKRESELDIKKAILEVPLVGTK